MNVNSGAPHILLFERDQQLTALLSGELGLAGYEVHTSRTAVEVFDAIARFPVRLVMVNLAQAQAGRREFWVALDAQRRGRGVQVFTFRCSNLGGYGPDDPEEHIQIQTITTDLEVDGPSGLGKLVDAVRARVPLPYTANTVTRPTQIINTAEAAPVYRNQEPSYAPPVQPAPPPVSNNPAYSTQYSAQPAPNNQPRPQQVQPPQESPVFAQQARPTADQPRTGHSTFTDKIRAVIYPSTRSASSSLEPNWTSQNTVPPLPNTLYQTPEVQPRPQASQRFAEADYSSSNAPSREEMRQASVALPAVGQFNQPGMMDYTPLSTPGLRTNSEESGLDQLSRLLRESQPASAMHGNTQNSAAQPALNVDPQQLQELQAQFLQAARLDEAYNRSTQNTQRPVPEAPAVNGQLRASPIQDVPFEREIEKRRAALAQGPEPQVRQPMSILQQAQPTPPVQQQQSVGTQQSNGYSQAYAADTRLFNNDSGMHTLRPLSPMRESPVEMTAAREVQGELPPLAAATSSQNGLDREMLTLGSSGIQGIPGQASPLNDEENGIQVEQMHASLQQVLGRRPEVRTTTDDTLLDIVKSLPPMAPAPQPPQTQILSGRATRSLGSVLLEGHLVPQERLQVAQHVQRMLRGVDLNYQLGEILLMFKLLTPDQLLAASLVSYGMISTIQITALGRIRQELHAIGLEYDLESLLILFRILTPEQLREVRASWSS